MNDFMKTFEDNHPVSEHWFVIGTGYFQFGLVQQYFRPHQDGSSRSSVDIYMGPWGVMRSPYSSTATWAMAIGGLVFSIALFAFYLRYRRRWFSQPASAV